MVSVILFAKLARLIAWLNTRTFTRLFKTNF